MTTDIWSTSYIKDLSQEDIDSFHEIAMKDVKNKDVTSDDRAILNNNLDLWLYCLQITRREIELQLSQHKTNLQSKLANFDDESFFATKDELKIAESKWRNNAMKFLNAVEKKTLYVKLLLEEEMIEE